VLIFVSFVLFVVDSQLVLQLGALSLERQVSGAFGAGLQKDSATIKLFND
jgi:hypothetical protein